MLLVVMKSANPPTATTKTASPPAAIIKFRRKLPRRALRDSCWRRSRAPCFRSYLSFRSAITASRSAYPSRYPPPRIYLIRPSLICQRENPLLCPFHSANGLTSYELEWDRAPLQEPANTKRAKTIRTANSPGCLPPPSLNMCWRWIPLKRANTSDKRPRIKLVRCKKTPIFTLSPPLRDVTGWPISSQSCDS